MEAKVQTQFILFPDTGVGEYDKLEPLRRINGVLFPAEVGRNVTLEVEQNRKPAMQVYSIILVREMVLLGGTGVIRKVFVTPVSTPVEQKYWVEWKD